MGNASSKVARRLPKFPPAATKPLAFESKNEAIEKDAIKDPYFMEKLNRLGPVRVDHHMQIVQTAGDIRNMYRSRMQSEAEASQPRSTTQNRLLASSLTELLEARKSVTTVAGLGTLAEQYHIDPAKLEQLSRYVSTPSIDERTVVRTADKHGDESLTMTARWVDPALPCA